MRWVNLDLESRREQRQWTMGVLCGHGNTFPNPPQVQFFQGKNTHLDKTQQVRFGNERGVVTAERKLTVGINRRDDDR